jgi:hypothetical protein
MKSSFERLLEPGFVVLFSINRDEEEVYTAAIGEVNTARA